MAETKLINQGNHSRHKKAWGRWGRNEKHPHHQNELHQAVVENADRDLEEIKRTHINEIN